MHSNRISLKILLYFTAAALLSAQLMLVSPTVYAQTASDSDAVVTDTDAVVSGSDTQDPGPLLEITDGKAAVSTPEMLAAALTDSRCTTVVLEKQAIYTIEEPLAAVYPLTIEGNGATVVFGRDAFLSVPENINLTVSDVTFSGQQSGSLSVSGSVTFGSNVFFGGRTGIILNKGGTLTSSGKAVCAAEGLDTLVYADPAGGSVILKDIRLSQASGSTDLLLAASSSGTVSLEGTVELLASGGRAIYCPEGGAFPDFAVSDGAVLSLAAKNALTDRTADIPGAAADIRSCGLTVGKGATVGITGSYCGVAAKSIILDSDASVTSICSAVPESKSDKCAALSASGKLICRSGSKVTVGSSGGNSSGGLFGGDSVVLEQGVSLVFRSDSGFSGAIVSDGAVTLGTECSVVSRGGGFGIRCRGLTAGDKCTLDIEDAALDGISSTASVKLGSNCTVDVSCARSALYATASVSFSSGTVAEFASDGDGAAVWLDGTSGDSLAINGCRVTVSVATNSRAAKNAAVYVSGAITLDGGSDVTVTNRSDFGLIAAGGSINVREPSTVLRCSGGAGILISQGSLLISDSASVFAEGTLDSAVRIERGSFSVTGGAAVDAQGARFGIEAMSGDVYIDNASFFDIRSTADRAVYVGNGRLTVLNVSRLSAWSRSSDGDNTSVWWTGEPEYDRSWELTQSASRDFWLYADHTALSPNLTHEYIQGVAQPTGFGWFDSQWNPSDYSRLGQYISRPTGRANSFNIPAGKAFSWMLFGSSYDDGLTFRLESSSGDGTFDLREDGTFTYTSLDYSRGVQTFDFVVVNSDGVSSLPVTVSILVTASKPPVVYSATVPIGIDEHYIGQVNIIDYDGTIASVRVDEQPQHGRLIMNSDGRFSYEPEFGYTGTDSFTYVAVDNMGDESNTGYITLAVGLSDTLTACNSTIVTESGVPASTRLTALLGADTALPAPQFEIIATPVYGVLEFDRNEPDLVTYIPYEDFSGTDIFTYAAVLEDGSLSEPARITVATVPSQRPSATGGIFYCTRNSSCSGQLSGYDIDGSINLYSIAENPSHGTVTLDAVTGKFVYQSGEDFTGEDIFAFTVTDSDGLVSTPVEVRIVVTSLLDNLRNTGRIGTATVLLCISLAAVAAVVALIIFHTARRRRELDEEKAMSRLFEFGGSGDDYYDNFDDYDN